MKRLSGGRASFAARADDNDVPVIMARHRTDTLSEAIEEARGFVRQSTSVNVVTIPLILPTDVRI